MTYHEITLPSYWASYLINGDASGLEPGELNQIHQSTPDLGDMNIVSTVEGSERFTWKYWLYNPHANCSGGEVCDYVAYSIEKEVS